MPRSARRICSRPRCSNLQPCPVIDADGRPHTRPAWGGASQHERTGEPGLAHATRTRILRRDFYTCQQCDKGQANQVDHIVPRSEGGADEDANLQTLCRECHSRKSGREGARARRTA